MIAALLCSLILPSLSSAEGLNTEVSTNLPLRVQYDRLGTVRVSLELDAAPTNNVEFAVGFDANLDGELSLEEADYTFGYDCGCWFVADTETGTRSEEPAPVEGRVSHQVLLRRRTYRACWDTLKFIRRGSSQAAEQLVVEVNYPGLGLIIK